MESLQRWTTSSGNALALRSIAPADVGALARFFEGLSMGSRYFRFGRLSVQFSEHELSSMCSNEPGPERHLVVTTEHLGGEILIASAHFFLLEDESCCEMEILVADAWQGHRIAFRLLQGLIQRAKDDGLRRMYATVLPTNARMLRFAKRHGFKPSSDERRTKLQTLYLDLALSATSAD